MTNSPDFVELFIAIFVTLIGYRIYPFSKLPSAIESIAPTSLKILKVVGPAMLVWWLIKIIFFT
jgi:hypothetical protein